MAELQKAADIVRTRQLISSHATNSVPVLPCFGNTRCLDESVLRLRYALKRLVIISIRPNTSASARIEDVGNELIVTSLNVWTLAFNNELDFALIFTCLCRFS